MKHAGAEALDLLDPLLAKIRKNSSLKEKSRGVFYRKSKAFLHFHEDDAGLFADLRPGDFWQRLRVSTEAEQAALMRMIEAELGNDPNSR